MSYLHKNKPSPKHMRAGFAPIIMFYILHGMVLSVSVTIGSFAKYTYKQTLDIIAPQTPFQKACAAIDHENPQALAEILDYNDEQEPGFIADVDAWYNGQLTYTQLTHLLRHAIMTLPSDDEALDTITTQSKQVTARLKDITNRRAIRSRLLKTGVTITDAISDRYIFNVIHENRDDLILFTKLRRIAPYRALNSLIEPLDNGNLLHVVNIVTIKPKTTALLLSQGVDAIYCNTHGDTPLRTLLYPTIRVLYPPDDSDNLLRVISLLYEYGHRNTNDNQLPLNLAFTRPGIMRHTDVITFLRNPESYRKNNPNDARLAGQSYNNSIKLDKNIVQQLHNKQIYVPSR